MDTFILKLIEKLDPILSTDETRGASRKRCNYRSILDPYRDEILGLYMGKRQLTFEQIAQHLKKKHGLDISSRVVSAYFQRCISL